MKKKNIIIFSVAAIIFVLDQVVKYLIKRYIAFGQNIGILTYIRNTGAGFGILKDTNIFLAIFGIIFLIIVLFFYRKINDNTLNNIGIGLIIGGTLGNLLDRILLGYVVDFINLKIWPVFNLADSALTIGAILLIIFWDKKK